MFFYVLSIYVFTSQAGWNILSNCLALFLIGLIWLEILLLRKEIIFNFFLFVYSLFIIICMVSVFYAIEPSTAFSKIQTLILIYILILSLINYVDTLEKLYFIMKCFIFSGFITSIYILINADFTVLERIGSELGNVNSIGMIIGISSILCLFYLLKTRNYWYSVIILTDLIVILLTGSRKALLFVVISIVLMLIFQEDIKLGSKFRALFISIVFIFAIFYIINNVPLFYQIIGERMGTMFDFFSSSGTADSSMNIRSEMILWGWSWFKEHPFLGYGIDNYRVLLSTSSGQGYTYSHNNVIELLVGTGIIGTALFYLANVIVIRDLMKASKVISKSLCYMFIAIIVGYMIMSVGMVYYDDKGIGFILAIGSIIYRLAKTEN